MFKILHRPSILALVSAASGGINNPVSSKSDEALLFAIYFAAITSLTEEECGAYFQQERIRLAVQYKSGLESALINADFLNTTELPTLQAFSLYLVSKPNQFVQLRRLSESVCFSNQELI